MKNSREGAGPIVSSRAGENIEATSEQSIYRHVITTADLGKTATKKSYYIQLTASLDIYRIILFKGACGQRYILAI
jgi:hypothetical protein